MRLWLSSAEGKERCYAPREWGATSCWTLDGRLLPIVSAAVVVIIEVVVTARPRLRMDAGEVGCVIGHAISLVGRNLRIGTQRTSPAGWEVARNSWIE